MIALRQKSPNTLEETLLIALEHDRFEVAYQPIYSARDTAPFAYEALLRAGEDISPCLILSLARRHRLLGQLEAAVLSRVLSESVAIPQERRIFINASRDALSNVRWLETAREFKHKVVLEIQDRNLSEHEMNLLSRFKEHGFALAFDDLGQTLDDFDALDKVRPQFVKTDRSLVRENKRDTIRIMADVAHAAEAQLIVEGIETREQHEMYGASADLVQGYFYGQPHSIKEVV